MITILFNNEITYSKQPNAIYNDAMLMKIELDLHINLQCLIYSYHSITTWNNYNVLDLMVYASFVFKHEITVLNYIIIMNDL